MLERLSWNRAKFFDLMIPHQRAKQLRDELGRMESETELKQAYESASRECDALAGEEVAPWRGNYADQRRENEQKAALSDRKLAAQQRRSAAELGLRSLREKKSQLAELERIV
jgi:hypothetical protein